MWVIKTDEREYEGDPDTGQLRIYARTIANDTIVRGRLIITISSSEFPDFMRVTERGMRLVGGSSQSGSPATGVESSPKG